MQLSDSVEYLPDSNQPVPLANCGGTQATDRFVYIQLLAWIQPECSCHLRLHEDQDKTFADL